jgi:hypothetical protein
MLILLSLILMLMPDLGGPFVDASATATPVTGGLQVELEVELNTQVATVVAHLVIPGDDQQTVALADRGNGRHGGLATVPAEDLVVVFEAIDVDRDIRALPVTLTELGVDPGVFRSDRTFAIDETGVRVVSPTARRWLWLAAALGAASLALVAWWAAGSRGGESVGERPVGEGPVGEGPVGEGPVGDADAPPGA